jgi:DNA-binding response OmpR family regulator
MQILIIEDEVKIVRVLEHALAAHGFEVVSTDNGEDGVRLAVSKPVSLVLLDIMLPGIDGYETLARIRAERPDLPVMMLTALDEMRDKVDALNSGADDYVTKPYILEELIARIRALTRRVDQQRSTVLQAGDLRMDILARRVRRGELPIDLSRREFDLLEGFMRHQGEILSRRDLLTMIWEQDFERDTNLVDVYIGYLRRKIDRPGEPSFINTVRGEGYIFDVPRTIQARAPRAIDADWPPSSNGKWSSCLRDRTNL